MIGIRDKKDCCGCSACVQKCPKQCISLKEDHEGFLYPMVDEGSCTDCGLCEKVCPVLNQPEAGVPIQVYAAVNPDEEVRMASSSGGVFTLLAEKVIADGGVVFGARFDANWQVTLDYAETKDGLAAFRGSKYVQARIADTYKQCEQFLKAGRKVLYSATPCQISGLKHFLRKEYDNLLAVDFVCHGVPSPLVWREYLKHLIASPKGISFRDKSTGWKKYSLLVRGNSAFATGQNSLLQSDDIICRETHDRNLFMQVFLKDLCLRPSCSSCPAKSGKSRSDITLADYWGISNHHPQWDDDKGTSLVMVHTSNGLESFQQVGVRAAETSYEQALAGNPSIAHSVRITKYVARFWEAFSQKGILGAHEVLNSMKPSYLKRLNMLVYRILKKILHVIKNK